MPSAGQSSSPIAVTALAQRLVLAFVAGSRHPVRRQHHAPQFRHRCGKEIGQGFRHGQPRGRGSVPHRYRRTLAHGHRLATMGVEPRQRHANVRYRGLERAHHLVPRHQPRNAAVADGDEELLRRDRGESEHAGYCLSQMDVAMREPTQGLGCSVVAPRHSGWMAKQRIEAHPHRQATQERVLDDKVRRPGCLAHHGKRAALAAGRWLRTCACPGAPPQARSAPATRCTKSPWATCRCRRSARRGCRSDRRGPPRAPVPAGRWRGRRAHVMNQADGIAFA